MPCIVMIRPTETIDIQVDDTDNLDELHAAVTARTPGGGQLIAVQPACATSSTYR